jgi:gluconate kinase
MSLIFVTGISTSGKSTMAKELAARGYEAYDTEHEGRSAWFDMQTGERVAGFNEMAERTIEWLHRHAWNIDIDWVKQMAERAKDKTIFICGGADNRAQVRELCDKVIWLLTDQATIRSRVNNPRDHDYGTKPHELEETIKWNTVNEAEFRNYGAIIIDARRPISQVVEDVIAIGSTTAR